MSFLERQFAKLFLPSILSVILLLVSGISNVSAQGGINHTGNGGRNAIQGTIFSPSGRRVDITGLKIKLESFGTGELTTFVDGNGKFGFSNLRAGSYFLVIEASEFYGQVRESVYIDDPSGSNRRSSNTVSNVTPRIINVPVYLPPKRSGGESTKADIINVNLVNIPKPALEQFKQAITAIEKNDAKLAVEKLNEAVKLHPQFAEAYSELGALYLKNGELNKAEEALSKALQLNERNAAAQLNYGIVLLNQRKMYEAEKALEKAVLADENAAIPHMYLGIALLGLNYLEYAEKEFLKAVSLRDDEKIAQAHKYLGGIYWKRKNYKQAVSELETYLKLSPKAPDAEKVRATIKQLREKIK